MTDSPLEALETFDAFVFDCDGTLAHTGPIHFHAISTALASFGHTISEPWFYRHGGLTMAGILEAFATVCGEHVTVDRVVPISTPVFMDTIANVREVAAVTTIARRYAGRKPMAVASSGQRAFVEATVEAIGLTPAFGAVVTIADVAHGKPAPDLYLEAARRLGVDPRRCLAFEDTAEGLEAARRAGMTCIDVRPLYDAIANEP